MGDRYPDLDLRGQPTHCNDWSNSPSIGLGTDGGDLLSTDNERNLEGLERRRFWLLNLLAVAPFVVFGTVYAVSEEWRQVFFEGWEAILSEDRSALENWGRERGVYAPIATSVLMIAQAIAAPIPAVLVTITNSLLFGWVWGGILSIASANLAASICYLIGRAWGEPLVRRCVSHRSYARSQRFLDEHGASAVLTARLIPLIPFDPISYLAGVGGMRFSTFFWSTLIGQIPAGMAYSWLGTRLGGETETFVQTALGVFAGLWVIGLIVMILIGRSSRDPGETGNLSDSEPQ